MFHVFRSLLGEARGRLDHCFGAKSLIHSNADSLSVHTPIDMRLRRRGTQEILKFSSGFELDPKNAPGRNVYPLSRCRGRRQHNSRRFSSVTTTVACCAFAVALTLSRSLSFGFWLFPSRLTRVIENAPAP